MPVRRRLLLLLLVALLVIGAGLGLRDPWPPDEPRFVLIARDLAAGGDWLVPRLAGEIYTQKPPVYFWALAASLAALPWPHVAFLLPSLLAALVVLALTVDLGRRLWTPEAGLAAGALLLSTVQFVVQARTAQIDMFVTAWITLGLYALARHLLLGPAWGWYALAWAAAGAGILTKGVGFLHLLFLVPALLLCAPPRPPASPWRWLAGPLVLIGVLAAWGVPMLLAARNDPALSAYRNELLLGQTVGRYVGPEGHRNPPWFFLTNVIPTLWQPAVLLLPWLVVRWAQDWRRGERTTLAFLAWLLLVLAFFSASPGKRGLYILPALPALALAAAPHLPALFREARVRVLARGLATVLALAAGGLALRLARGDVPAAFEAVAGAARPLAALAAAIAGVGAAAALAGRGSRALPACAAALAATWCLLSWVATPLVDAARSGRPLMARVNGLAGAGTELGLIGWKEQQVLHAGRPVTHFGWRARDRVAEAAAAARWLGGAPERRLLLPDASIGECFERTALIPLGTAHDQGWFLAAADAVRAGCDASRGELPAPVRYAPATPWPAPPRPW